MATIKLQQLGLVLGILALSIGPTLTYALFDELDELKKELLVWQTTHAADFSDLVNTLDDITGPQFDDVLESDWFSPYVASVSGWGIVSGYKDAMGKKTGRFGPGNAVTIAELLKMTLEAAKTDRSSCSLVPPMNQAAIGHWASEYISCGESVGVRLFDSTLNVNRRATRAEVIAVIHDAFKDEVPQIFSNFRDTAGHKYEADIAYAQMQGIVTGDKDALGTEIGTFRPNDDINRAEVAKILYERLRLEVLE